ncbi:LysR family transcriptional regulator [Brachybacterium epidermidis]|uniref:LysR family transcriptional regulator n=1 Tax=Brachybacterium epidermidis TaxID=2781983 RepID=UPI00398E50B4
MDLLRHLELFEAVADEGHFGRAAESLGMAQPPLSQAIKRLEKELGCTLLERTAHGSVLTPAGRRVRDAARRLQSDATALRATAVGDHKAPIRLMVDPVVPESLLASLVTHAGSQGIAIQLEECSSDAALHRVRAGDGTAVVLSPFRTEGLRSSAPLALKLWASRLVSNLGPKIGGSGGAGTALVHPRPPAAVMARLSVDLRSLGLPGPIGARERASALGELLTGRLVGVVTVSEPGWTPVVADELRVEPLPRSRATAILQVVARRDERDRSVLAAFESASTTLARTAETMALTACGSTPR